jgi:hypothetical protein
MWISVTLSLLWKSQEWEISCFWQRPQLGTSPVAFFPFFLFSFLFLSLFYSHSHSLAALSLCLSLPISFSWHRQRREIDFHHFMLDCHSYLDVTLLAHLFSNRPPLLIHGLCMGKATMTVWRHHIDNQHLWNWGLNFSAPLFFKANENSLGVIGLLRAIRCIWTWLESKVNMLSFARS